MNAFLNDWHWLWFLMGAFSMLCVRFAVAVLDEMS